MKGYEEPTTTFIDILTIIIFTLFVFGSLITMTRFKTDVKDAGQMRLAIDLGENVLAASCLTNIKGVFNETKLNNELSYWECAKNKADLKDKDGISCIQTDFLAKVSVYTKERTWSYGDANGKMARFPAIVKKENGETVPAVLVVEVEAGE